MKLHVGCQAERSVESAMRTSSEIKWCLRRIIVIGMQLAYYGAAVIKVRDYTFNTTGGKTYTPIPDWGWILGAVAGVLWLIIAGISACALRHLLSDLNITPMLSSTG